MEEKTFDEKRQKAIDAMVDWYMSGNDFLPIISDTIRMKTDALLLRDKNWNSKVKMNVEFETSKYGAQIFSRLVEDIIDEICKRVKKS